MLRREFIIAFILIPAACNSTQRPASELDVQRETVPVVAESININTASIDDLQRIPHIGETIAKEIVEHREKFGPFKRPEHIMLIRGMSDVRFRRIRHLIRVE